MKKTLWTLVLLAIVSAPLFANEIFLSRTDEKSNLSLSKEDFSNAADSYMLVKVHVKSVVTEEVATAKGNFTLLTIPGFHSTNKIGQPQLPAINRLIEVPFGAKVSIQFVNKGDAQEFAMRELGVNSPIYPAQPSVRKDQKEGELVINRDAYTRGYSEDEMASIEEVGVLRNYHLCVLQVIPAAYNPAEGKLKFYSDVEVKISLKDCNMETTRHIKANYTSEAFEAATGAIVKSPSLSVFARRDNALKYLIIADPMFKNALQPFIDYRSKTHKVQVKYTDEIGATAQKIRDYLKAEYAHPADGIPATFLMLVGDNEQIPAHPGNDGNYITDVYYASVDQDGDYLPEFLTGRFSAQTVDQLTPQLDKTIAYDSGALPDYSFLKRTVLVAGWDAGWAVKRGYPQIRYGTEYYFNEAHGFVDVAAHTHLTNGSQQKVAEIIAAISKGVGFYNYTAHGTETAFYDPGFKRSDVDSLTNHNMYAVVVGNCCLTNSFQIDDCFGERWLRAANKGAVGYIGGTCYTYWDEDMWWGVGACAITSDIDSGHSPKKEDTGTGAYDSAFGSLNHFTNAGAMLAGNLAVQEAKSSRVRYYFEVYHLLGDSGLKAYWANPNNPPHSATDSK